MPASGELARRVVEAGRRCSLTTSVLGEWASAGSPKQVEYLARYLDVFRQVFLSQPRHKDVSRAVTYPEPLPSPA